MNIMSRRIIGRDVASTEMVVSVGLTSEFCELGCIGLTWYERVGCGNGVGSMARACWFYEGALGVTVLRNVQVGQCSKDSRFVGQGIQK